MNLDEINSLLEYVKNQIIELDSELNPILLKNTLENLRSVLDYCAIDISKISNEEEKKIYFPYGQRQNHFKKSIKRNLPNLNETHSEIYSLLESLQPYKCNNQWLIDLCDLTNEAKHNNFNKTITNKKISSVDIPGIHIKDPDNIIVSNNTYNGINTGHIEIKEGEITNMIEGVFKFEIKEENKIFFSNKEIEIMPFLKATNEKIRDFINKTYALIEE